ncbi:outer membrane assembly protein AsmA [Erwinia pyrifoliae]|uniref:outer membrane assembly protein AsmA n=1 Tax=Erwinia pyrifoliae TaxID=79967 RepID=UPI0001960C21|nr:outer membrane assembly protein AsmA [Erwinia pyrifoliae]AUX73104.1 outer membrane assembly protein AsmA [Erwinia pyrifoliae]MCA8876614.1 outer membrane assembly protein AsmA [Erwinia pyrifoliae]MCT2386729.1 outer membrane assembly protein AsmA [Erwinia pyrifoliae]MCU8587673.1 outer membrane assembly protein AsmA [Erwinia pyrifoliae]UXK11046.1 outer membrane assembly protein AsmA [Erwinia pyrifoliae]
MKRFITTLAILLVVVVAGMTALVMLVNPNDFRAYMVRQVEQRSGYHLALNGDLRWHVWPQLSILSGPVTLTAPGARQPVVSAANMRLDVNLLPLFSHQLSVKQVMLKGAVIRLTPDSKSLPPVNAPIGPAGSSTFSPTDDVARGWKFDISHLRIADGLLVWQQSNGEQLNVRDLNLALDQNQPRQVHIEISSRINRDQRELQLDLSSELDITDYPQRVKAIVQQSDYQLKGVDLPLAGIQGKAQMKANWESLTGRFSLEDIHLNANDSQLSGTLSGTLGAHPELLANLHIGSLDLDSLLGLSGAMDQDALATEPRSGHAPVIASVPVTDNVHSVLNALDGQLTLAVDQLRWRQMQMNHVLLHAASQQGLLTMNTFKGTGEGGSFSLPGTVDARGAPTKVTLIPELKQIAMSSLLKGFELPDTISGSLSLRGRFSGDGLNVAAFKHQWQGQAELSLDDAQFAGLNLMQMVQRAVENNSAKVRGKSDDGTPNPLHLQGSATLNNGVIAFSRLDASSAMLTYNASGSIDLIKKNLDVLFGVTIAGGWSGDSELVQRLQQLPVPLRVYGPWSAVNYNLKVDQLLRQQVRDEARHRLQKWIKRNPDKSDSSDVKKLINEL